MDSLLGSVFLKRSLRFSAWLGMVGVVLLVAMFLARLWRPTSNLALTTGRLQPGEHYPEGLEPYGTTGLKQDQANPDTCIETGQMLHNRDCSSCHNGAPEANSSATTKPPAIPPEILISVRTKQPYPRPLDSVYSVLSSPEPFAPTVVAAVRQETNQVFDQMCVACHGSNGSGQTPTAQTLKSPPPNFQEFTLSPQRSFEIISNGYPGTQMPAYAYLAEDVRRGLVVLVEDFYLPDCPSGSN